MNILSQAERQAVLTHFIHDGFQQIDCPQCENTFLTRVYDLGCSANYSSIERQPVVVSCRKCQKSVLLREFSSEYVLLEKYALGLEYYLDAAKHYPLHSIPKTQLLGLLNEQNELLDPRHITLFSKEEPAYRLIYVMERLSHLNAEEEHFFDQYVYDLEEKTTAERTEIIAWVNAHYSAALALDIQRLFDYFLQHQRYIQWDLHGHNLMYRPHTKTLMILDPYAPNYQ